MSLQTLRIFTAIGLAAVTGVAISACMQGGAKQTAFEAKSVPGYGLFYMDEGASAKLAYGQANSDNVGLMLQCQKGSRQIDVTDAVRSTPSPTLTLASSGAQSTLKAETQSFEGAPLMVARHDDGRRAPSGLPPLGPYASGVWKHPLWRGGEQRRAGGRRKVLHRLRQRQVGLIEVKDTVAAAEVVAELRHYADDSVGAFALLKPCALNLVGQGGMHASEGVGFGFHHHLESHPRQHQSAAHVDIRRRQARTQRRYRRRFGRIRIVHGNK